MTCDDFVIALIVFEKFVLLHVSTKLVIGNAQRFCGLFLVELAVGEGRVDQVDLVVLQGLLQV